MESQNTWLQDKSLFSHRANSPTVLSHLSTNLQSRTFGHMCVTFFTERPLSVLSIFFYLVALLCCRLKTFISSNLSCLPINTDRFKVLLQYRQNRFYLSLLKAQMFVLSLSCFLQIPSQGYKKAKYLVNTMYFLHTKTIFVIIFQTLYFNSLAKI